MAAMGNMCCDHGIRVSDNDYEHRRAGNFVWDKSASKTASVVDAGRQGTTGEGEPSGEPQRPQFAARESPAEASASVPRTANAGGLVGDGTPAAGGGASGSIGAASSWATRGDKRGNSSDTSIARGEWDPEDFLRRLKEARRQGGTGYDVAIVKKVLVEVAESNYQLRSQWAVPRTHSVPQEKCAAAAGSLRPRSRTQVSFSSMFTGDAMHLFAKDGRNKVCGLNFANGEHVGGGYKNGAMAQEEDLCRMIPSLYSSLFNAKNHGLYPFGPCTCKSVDRPEKYSEVLYTKGLVLARTSESNGYALLPKEQQRTVALVTAAAPNINFAKEVYDLRLIHNTIKSIFIAPLLDEPDLTTIILGAWGCGAFGGDPIEISELFARALLDDGLGQMYDEIHFAIPAGANHNKFRETFVKRGIPVKDLDAERGA